MHFRKSDIYADTGPARNEKNVSHSTTKAEIISFDAGLR